jgi:hypothetical protein
MDSTNSCAVGDRPRARTRSKSCTQSQGRKLNQLGAEIVGAGEYALRNDDAPLVRAAVALRYLQGANDTPVVARR